MATELTSEPFFIKNSWYIGGLGNWDSLTLDTAARRLYIAHTSLVQIVDVDSGSPVAELSGFREAHAIALDDRGEYGYVSDGPTDEVKVFDRRRLVIESIIPIHCSPRSITFEPRSKLVFAICGGYPVSAASPNGPGRRPYNGAQNSRTGNEPQGTSVSGVSQVVAIDTQSSTVLAEMVLGGDFRFAQPDGDGQVYISVGPARLVALQNGKVVQEMLPARIARLDALSLVSEAHRFSTQSPSESSPEEPLRMDWSIGGPPSSVVHFLQLDSVCSNPQGLAVDGKHFRLFVTCDNQALVVLNAETGEHVATLMTGPGNDAIGYDPERDLIFTANGFGYGSLTVVRQYANIDSYAEVQNLPTRERARTLAVDSATGDVYLVTDFQGVDLDKPGGIGSMQVKPLPGTFQVLVVGR